LGEGAKLSAAARMGELDRAFHLTRSGNSVKPSELWHSRNFYVRQCNLVEHDGLVWGANGGIESFHGADLKTGKIVWQQRVYARGNSVLLPDGRLIILDEDGKLTMAKPSGKGLEPISQAQVLTSESWTAPSLVGTRLYVRNRAEMAVFGDAHLVPGR